MRLSHVAERQTEWPCDAELWCWARVKRVRKHECDCASVGVCARMNHGSALVSLPGYLSETPKWDTQTTGRWHRSDWLSGCCYGRLDCPPIGHFRQLRTVLCGCYGNRQEVGDCYHREIKSTGCATAARIRLQHCVWERATMSNTSVLPCPTSDTVISKGEIITVRRAQRGSKREDRTEGNVWERRRVMMGTRVGVGENTK